MTTATPLISAIIPVYNNERFLGEAIASVLAQSYRPLQLIVVDDGSTDGTATVAKSFDRAEYIYKANGGPASARNVGIDAAQGDYLAFLDSDDLWEKDKLEIQMNFHQDNPAIRVSYTLMRNFLQQGASRPSWSKPEQDKPFTGLFPDTMLAEREVFKDVGKFDPTFMHGENIEWIARLKEKGIRYHVIEKTLTLRRVHENNLTNLADSERSYAIRALKQAIDRRRGLQKDD